MAEGSLWQWKKKSRLNASHNWGIRWSVCLFQSRYPVSMVGVTGAVSDMDGQYSEQAWEDRFLAFIWSQSN